MCGLDVEVGGIYTLLLRVVYALAFYVKVFVYVYVCECVPVALSKQVGPLCM